MPQQSSAVNFSPAASYEEALDRACSLWGVQREYWDIFGNHHVAPVSTQADILRSLGVATDSKESIDAAVEKRLWNTWSRAVAPVLVLKLSEEFVPVYVPQSEVGKPVRAVFLWEDGSTEETEAAGLEQDGTADLRGERFVRCRYPLPASARLGYHTVVVSTGGQPSEARLILCPDHAWQPDSWRTGGKGAGIAISLYGLRSDRNWGCGDFTDLNEFSRWAASALDVSFVALNPLHSIPNRQPYNTSPYLPNSSFYRNPLYLDVEAVEDVKRSAWAQRLLKGERMQSCIAELRASDYVEYEKVWSLKRRFLKLGFREFLGDHGNSSERRRAFDDYVEQEGGLLHRFAVFQALDEVLHKRDRNLWIWPDWPEHYRNADSPEVAAFEREYPRLVLFFKYLQWLLDGQLAESQRQARATGMSIGLYHDLALATDRCGSDLWAHGSYYVSGCRVGSPPDDFSPQGQDWAFPPPDSVHHHDTGYGLFIESVRKNIRHGGALRIDHVMRFFRLFWIPDGHGPKEGVYVLDHADDLLRILALESVRNRVLVIGEDLGTVEPYIRTALQSYGILSYRLLYFEKNKDGSFHTPGQYPRHALVSVSTHDLPTLAGFWLHRDIEARRAAGVLPDEASYHSQNEARLKEKQRLLDVMFASGLLPEWFPRRAADVPDFTGELHNAAVGFLARTPSVLMVLNQEDLFKETDQQNLPGTTEQYPNWRHKLRYSVAEIGGNPEAQGCVEMFRHWVRTTSRANQPDER